MIQIDSCPRPRFAGSKDTVNTSEMRLSTSDPLRNHAECTEDRCIHTVEIGDYELYTLQSLLLHRNCQFVSFPDFRSGCNHGLLSKSGVRREAVGRIAKRRRKRSSQGIHPPSTLPGHAFGAIRGCEAPGTKRIGPNLNGPNRQGDSGWKNVM